MKPIAITAIIVLALAFLGWLRADHDFDPRTVLPFLSARAINVFDWGGLTLALLGLWGFSRLKRPPANAQNRDDDYEYDEPDDPDSED